MNRIKNNFLLIISLLLLLSCVVINNVFLLNVTIDERKVLNSVNKKIIDIIEDAKKTLDKIEEHEQNYSNIENNLTEFFNIFIYQGEEVKYWSTSNFFPRSQDIRGNFSIKFIQSGWVDYLVIKQKKGKLTLIATIIIRRNYSIKNRYFQSGLNSAIFNEKTFDIAKKTKIENIISYNNIPLFGLKFTKNTSNTNSILSVFCILLFLMSIIFYVIHINKIACFISQSNFLKGLGFIVGSHILFRYLLFELSLPSVLSEQHIFNSRIYAASVLNTSLADLILNLVLLLSIVKFMFQQCFISESYHRFVLSIRKTYLFYIVLFLIVIVTFYFLNSLFDSIYHNSQISIDVNKGIQIDVIFVSTTLILVIAFAIVLLMMLVIIKNVRIILKNKNSYPIKPILNQNLGYESIIPIVFIVLIISMFSALKVVQLENKRLLFQKQNFAEQFINEEDHIAEFLLSEMKSKVDNDVFIKTRMSSPFASKGAIKSKIQNVYLNNYLDKYDIDIYLFDANKKNLDNSYQSFEQLSKYFHHTYSTRFKGLYLLNLLDGESTKRYINLMEVNHRGILVGYIVLELKLKRVIPNRVYPKMLSDNRFKSNNAIEMYSYALIRDNKIISNSADFEFSKNDLTPLNQANFDVFEESEYELFAIDEKEKLYLIILKNGNYWNLFLSNFSYLFLLSNLILLTILFIIGLYMKINKNEILYSVKIQFYLNAAFFIPLILVSITTLRIINLYLEDKLLVEHTKKASITSESLSESLENLYSGEMNKDEFRREVLIMSKNIGSDINVFDLKGKLIATNQPEIYDSHFLSERVNFQAFRNIIELGNKKFTGTERVGEISYYNTYYELKSYQSGNLMGMMSIPFFESEQEMRNNQAIIFSNIMNVVALAIIILLITSYFVSKWITFPLKLITEKLKKTSLNYDNKPIIWEVNDEIGLMVSAYNKMLIELEESKIALEKTQKMVAWREIAKQLAHEVKNPLTPMKLTLQHIRQKLSFTNQNEEYLPSIESVLTQVDSIDNIISSLNSFAKMPVPERKKYELITVLRHTLSLFNSNKRLDIKVKYPSEKIYTKGDQKLMGRIFSNLILNALESDDRKMITLNIGIDYDKQNVTIRFEDNGRGILLENYDRVFLSNFSTKTNGSGIGLALAKHGIDNAGGKIWFESSVNVGTTFFIQLERE